MNNGLHDSDMILIVICDCELLNQTTETEIARAKSSS